MVEQSQTLFLIDRIQPSYLTEREKWNYVIAIGLFLGLILGGFTWINLELMIISKASIYYRRISYRIR